MKFLSPAKINLFLNVSGKRKDGFHELRTLYERVSLCDDVSLSPLRSGIRILTDRPDLPMGPKNLAYRAAQLLKVKFGIQKGIVIRIQKRIPVQAGLGGGSSNAATVLLGLNKLWKLGLSKKELCKLGAEIGSDVPFFVLETPFAVGHGRGEILKPIRIKGTKLWHVIVKPPFGISTKQAYQAFDDAFTGPAASTAPFSQVFPLLERGDPVSASPVNASSGRELTLQKVNVRMLLRSLKKCDSGRLQELLTNSLEVTGSKQLTYIFSVKKKMLEAGALASLMSGSGSSVFGIFASRARALKAARILKRNRSWQVFVVSTF